MTKEFLTGKEITTSVITHAAEIMAGETAPIDDIRGRAGYKKLLLRQLFYTHFITLFPQHIRTEDLA
jgi:xanthine dehydrogenase small subunit